MDENPVFCPESQVRRHSRGLIDGPAWTTGCSGGSLEMGHLRFTNAGNYLIAAPNRNPLNHGVLDGSRSPRVMGAILRGRE